MAYLVRSLQSGSQLAKHFWQQMIDNVEAYLDEGGVRSGMLKPSDDPRARARYLAMASGGGFLLYLQLHESPDLRQVLHDYAEEMVLPALEVFTKGLMADSTMYDAFVEQREKKGIPFSPAPQGDGDDSSDDAAPTAG